MYEWISLEGFQPVESKGEIENQAVVQGLQFFDLARL